MKVPSRAELPQDFPARFPLPAGTIITSAQASTAGGIVVRGLVPRTLSGAKDFFELELPAAGFQAGEGDAERGEAEAEFSGNGVQGKWKVNAFADCPGAVALLVAVARTT